MSHVILLVEDNLSDEKLALLAFKRSGLPIEVVVARDGEGALAHLHGQTGMAPELPAVVLLDLNLPRLSGLDVLKRIRNAETTRLLPVVVLTSSTEDEDVLQSYAFGANAYVRKPVDFSEFSRTANTLGLFWVLLNERPSRRPVG